MVHKPTCSTVLHTMHINTAIHCLQQQAWRKNLWQSERKITLYKCAETWWYLADCGRVPAVSLVTVGTLDKNGTVAEALGEHLPSNVIQPHAATCGIQNSKNVKRRDNWSLLLVITALSVVEVVALVPICLRVISTVAFLLTLLRSPKQKRSELEGSVKPSTVKDGCDAWNVSPTRWFSS